MPGLAAKPVLDLVVEVADPALEGAYVPRLAVLGYSVSIREPEWYEHRLLRRTSPDVHLHVFPHGCLETDRMVRFADRLRSSPPARARYAQTKRELAARDWASAQEYADAKSVVVEGILRT